MEIDEQYIHSPYRLELTQSPLACSAGRHPSCKVPTYLPTWRVKLEGEDACTRELVVGKLDRFADGRDLSDLTS